MISNQDQKALDKIIRESPLSDPEKETLLAALHHASETDLAAALDVALAEHVRQQRQVVERAVSELAGVLAAEDSKYEAARAALEEDLNRNLSKVDLNDIIQRQKIRDEYYTAADKLRTERERALRDVIARSTLPKSS